MVSPSGAGGSGLRGGSLVAIGCQLSAISFLQVAAHVDAAGMGGEVGSAPSLGEGGVADR